MEALNAASFSPLCVLPERITKPRRASTLPSFSSIKLSASSSLSTNLQTLHQSFSRSLHGGLVLVSSIFGGGTAGALTYEEALQQSVGIPPAGEFEANGVLDSLLSFVTENPAVVAGGAALLVVPLVLSQLLGKPKSFGVESARNAYAKLGDESKSQLLDIRGPAEFRRVGSPDIRGLGKKPVSIVYKGEDKPGFLKKLSSKFKEPGSTTLFILDKFDGNSELVAELVTVNGFKAAYAIKDGAEGPRGWMNSGLPWVPPRKALSLDIGDFTYAISGAIGESTDGLSVTLALAVATGLGLFTFTQVETILQILGSAALIQLVSKKLLFAEDRKQTIQQVDEFLNTKVGRKELVDEIKQIGKALLPSPVTGKALLEPATPPAQKSEATPEPKVEESAPEINSVPKLEVQAESLSGLGKPLSPYPYYPDFKPPTSPTPSQP